MVWTNEHRWTKRRALNLFTEADFYNTSSDCWLTSRLSCSSPRWIVFGSHGPMRTSRIRHRNQLTMEPWVTPRVLDLDHLLQSNLLAYNRSFQVIVLSSLWNQPSFYPPGPSGEGGMFSLHALSTHMLILQVTNSEISRWTFYLMMWESMEDLLTLQVIDSANRYKSVNTVL